jgi:hypothetical protein
LLNLKTSDKEIKEYTNKTNISKTIWRQLTINLDTERAVDSLKNMKKFEEWKARKEIEKSTKIVNSNFFKNNTLKQGKK